MTTLTTMRRRGTVALAWLSFLVAVGAGALAADMWIGKAVETVVHAFPWPWLAAVLLVIAFLGTAIDLFLDGEPNQLAVYSAMLMPSLAASTDGQLARTVMAWSGDILRWIDRDLTGYLGTASSTGLAVGAIAAAVMMSRRVIKKSHGGGYSRRSRANTTVVM